MVKIGECLTNSIKNTSFSTVKSIFGLPLREGEDIAWLVSDSGMEEMRGEDDRGQDIPAIHPCLKVGHAA